MELWPATAMEQPDKHSYSPRNMRFWEGHYKVLPKNKRSWDIPAVQIDKRTSQCIEVTITLHLKWLNDNQYGLSKDI